MKRPKRPKHKRLSKAALAAQRRRRDRTVIRARRGKRRSPPDRIADALILDAFLPFVTRFALELLDIVVPLGDIRPPQGVPVPKVRRIGKEKPSDVVIDVKAVPATGEASTGAASNEKK